MMCTIETVGFWWPGESSPRRSSMMVLDVLVVHRIQGVLCLRFLNSQKGKLDEIKRNGEKITEFKQGERSISS